MQVCTSLQTDNHASTPPLIFLQAGCPSCRPTNSVKALKASQSTVVVYNGSKMHSGGEGCHIRLLVLAVVYIENGACHLLFSHWLQKNHSASYMCNSSILKKSKMAAIILVK